MAACMGHSPTRATMRRAFVHIWSGTRRTCEHAKRLAGWQRSPKPEIASANDICWKCFGPSNMRDVYSAQKMSAFKIRSVLAYVWASTLYLYVNTAIDPECVRRNAGNRWQNQATRLQAKPETCSHLIDEMLKLR